MSEIKKIGFGSINDNDESLQSKVGGKFGLNQGNITHIAYNPTAGKDGAAADAVDVTFVPLGSDKEFRLRVYDIAGGDLYSGGDLVPAGDTPEYNKAYNEELTQKMAIVTHAIKAVGVSQETIDTALATPPATFADWAKIMTSLVPTDFATKPVDAFLEFQWTIGEGNARTYLQLPKNMKSGRCLCPSMSATGSWKEIKDDKGLRYVDDSGAEHTFSRNANYMEGNKANQQIEGEASGDGSAIAASETGAKATW